MISLVPVVLPIHREKGLVSHTSPKTKWEYGSSVRPMAVLPFFYFLNISWISSFDISSHSIIPGNLGCGAAKL